MERDQIGFGQDLGADRLDLGPVEQEASVDDLAGESGNDTKRTTLLEACPRAVVRQNRIPTSSRLATAK